MNYQWLTMRITEEQDRRKREALILERLPRALAEMHESLSYCLRSYTDAFGAESANLQISTNMIRIVIREQRNDRWQEIAKIDIGTDTTVPGFQIDRAGDPLVIEVGMLPGDKLFYRDCAQDQYLSMEETARRILDRSLFPKLGA